MVSTALGIILEDLGKTSSFPVTGLVPDVNNTCAIKIGAVVLRIELDKTEQNLLVGCQVGKILRGPLRLELFREALRANNFPSPRYGTFAYSIKTENLVLFDYIPLNGLTGDKLAEYLGPFLEKASLWAKSITANEVPPASFTPKKGLSSIFDIVKSS